MESAIALRILERLVIYIGGIVCIYLGYRLFYLSNQNESDGLFNFKNITTMGLKRIGPGVFFALFGSWILYTSLTSKVSIRQPGPAVTQYAQKTDQQILEEMISFMQKIAPALPNESREELLLLIHKAKSRFSPKNIIDDIRKGLDPINSEFTGSNRTAKDQTRVKWPKKTKALSRKSPNSITAKISPLHPREYNLKLHPVVGCFSSVGSIDGQVLTTGSVTLNEVEDRDLTATLGRFVLEHISQKWIPVLRKKIEHPSDSI